MKPGKRPCLGTHDEMDDCTNPSWDGERWFCEASSRIAAEAFFGTDELERRLQAGDDL